MGLTHLHFICSYNFWISNHFASSLQDQNLTTLWVKALFRESGYVFFIILK
jgi:hypothetical protein